MKSPYFCAQHAKTILQNEREAFSSWTEMMRIGIQAYSQCRLDAATIYLGAALDIAFLRNTCEKNDTFNSVNIIKPAEFLLALMLSEQRLHRAARLLARVRESTKSSQQNTRKHFMEHPGEDAHLEQFLQVNTQRINSAFSGARRLSQCASHEDQLVH